MRLVRLMKVFRVVRVMKFCRSLRVLIGAVAASMGALMWSMILLFSLGLVGAMLFAHMVTPYIEDDRYDLELRLFLWGRFGTWFRAMFTIFEITMAPGGFLAYRRLHEEVSPTLGAFLIVYVAAVTFAVVRIITAIFLKETLSATQRDDCRILELKQRDREDYAARLGKMLDAEGSLDLMNIEEFHACLKFPQMREWLADVEVTSTEADRLFYALDEEGTGEIAFMEFIAALLKMDGPPKTADSVLLFTECRSILHRIKQLEVNAGKSRRKEHNCDHRQQRPALLKMNSIDPRPWEVRL